MLLLQLAEYPLWHAAHTELIDEPYRLESRTETQFAQPAPQPLSDEVEHAAELSGQLVAGASFGNTAAAVKIIMHAAKIFFMVVPSAV